MRKILSEMVVMMSALSLGCGGAHAQEIGMLMIPFTFIGRITDAENIGFNADWSATIRAYSADNQLLAQAKTFTKSDTVNNYRLPIQMTNVRVEGYANADDPIVIEVTDAVGKTWAGVAGLNVVGTSGDVKQLNIQLADTISMDGRQVDKNVYKNTKTLWRYSPYYQSGETFDITKDYDRDGVSTLDEVNAGTDPFDENDCFKITDFRLSPETNQCHHIVFTVAPGRAYVLESADDVSGTWTETEFLLGESEKPQKALSVQWTEDPREETIRLFPVKDAKHFYRIRLH